MAVLSSWLKGLKSAEDKAKFKETLQHAQPVFKVLTQIIDDLIAQNGKDSLKKEIYERPNWALEQADLVGETRAYKKVIDILKKSLTK